MKTKSRYLFPLCMVTLIIVLGACTSTPSSTQTKSSAAATVTSTALSQPVETATLIPSATVTWPPYAPTMLPEGYVTITPTLTASPMTPVPSETPEYCEYPQGTVLLGITLNEETDIYRLDLACLSRPEGCEPYVERLTSGPGYSAQGYYSPDATRILFLSTTGDTPIDQYVHMMDADGELEWLVASIGIIHRFHTWSPDGETILFTAEIDKRQAIFTMDKDGTDLFRVPGGLQYNTSAEMSWTGRYIALYARDNMFASDASLFIFDTKTRVSSLFQNSISGYAWKNEGDKLLYRVVEADQAVLYEYDFETEIQRELMDISGWLKFSPDGNQVGLTKEVDGNDEIYLVNLDGSGLRRITYDDKSSVITGWSSDGQFFYYYTVPMDPHDPDYGKRFYLVWPEGGCIFPLFAEDSPYAEAYISDWIE